MAAAGVDSMYAYGYGRNSFSSSGLSTATGTATGYGFDARAASNAADVAALAAAFGIEGTPELKDGAWIVGSQDGTTPSLSVGLDGLLSFSYSDPRIVPWPCVADTEPAQPCEQTGTGVVPTEDAAIDSIRSLIQAAGRDPEGFEYTSQTWEGSLTRTAQAWPVVDGQRIDQPWSIELASDGISTAYGALAGLVSLGDYDVVSEQQAFERLSDPRFGAQMTNLPIALREPAAGSPVADAPEEWVPPTEPPAAPTAGAPVVVARHRRRPSSAPGSASRASGSRTAACSSFRPTSSPTTAAAPGPSSPSRTRSWTSRRSSRTTTEPYPLAGFTVSVVCGRLASCRNHRRCRRSPRNSTLD